MEEGEGRKERRRMGRGSRELDQAGAEAELLRFWDAGSKACRCGDDHSQAHTFLHEWPESLQLTSALSTLYSKFQNTALYCLWGFAYALPSA